MVWRGLAWLAFSLQSNQFATWRIFQKVSYSFYKEFHKMVQKCCVFGCSSSADVPSHKFPSNREMLERWANNIRFFRKNAVTIEDFYKFRVCYLHFAETDYKTGGYRRRILKDNAIPTLHLPMIVNTDHHENNTNIIVPEGSNSEPDNVHVHEDTIEDINMDNNEAEPGPSCRNITGSSMQRTRRFHLLGHEESSMSLTPTATRLYRVANRIRKHQLNVSRKLFGYKRRLKEAEKYIQSKTFQKLTSTLSYDQRVFLNMQLRNTSFQPKGRRFTMEEKILALSLYKQSGRCYRFLEKIFSLPSARSLRGLLHAISLKTGCNQFIKDQLKKEVEGLKEKDKVCFLMWDEIALQPHLDYNQTSHSIIGFEDFGIVRRPKYADHALVFMIKGIDKGWKFPVAYFFSDSQTNSECLISCIKKVTKIIIECGLIPVAYICDQARPNVAAINKLKFNSYIKAAGKLKYENSIHLYERDIIPLYDPPHLIKGIRNNLLKRDLELDFKNNESKERRFATWKIIQLAYNMDSRSNSLYRLMPKITEHHINQKYIKKMRVKLAAQVLSRTMAGFIDHHTKFDSSMDTSIGRLHMPKEGHDTAEAVLFFDQLFDSVNGHTFKPETPLRAIVKSDSRHHTFWATAINKLQNMRFVNTHTKEAVFNSPVLKHWRVTLEGFQKLWQILKELNFKYLKPRHINQDSLENFFGSIRSLNFRYNNPTCTHFESAFKTLLLNNLTSRQLVGNNCESICNGTLLFTIKNLNANRSNIGSETEEIQNLIIQDFTKTQFATFLNTQLTDQIITKILKNKEVESCSNCYSIFSDISNVNFFEEAYEFLLTSLPNVCFKRNLKLILQTILLTNMNFDFVTCQSHKNNIINLYINTVISYTVISWCRFVNQILKGKRPEMINSHSIYKRAIQRSQRNSAKKRTLIK